MHENKNFSSFYFELSDIVNSSFNLEEPISNSKVVRKILRSLLERFRPKVTIIEKSRDIDSLRVDEPVNSIQTYEVTLPSSQKSKDFTFKTSKNEEKYNKMPHNITRDGLAHMAERIKKVMKFNKKFYKNQESKKWKRPNEQSSKEKDKGSSKCKKIECFNVVVWDTLLLIILTLKILKSLCKLLGVIQTLKKVVIQLLKMQGTILIDFLAFIASVEFVHDSECDSDSDDEFTNDQKATFLNNLFLLSMKNWLRII